MAAMGRNLARVPPVVPPGHHAQVDRFDTGTDIRKHVALIGHAAYLSWTDPVVCALADDVVNARWHEVHRGARAIPLQVGRRTYYLQPADPRARGDLARIWSFVDANVAYAPDLKRWDTFRVALATLALGAGDCDDHCILIDSLAKCRGYRVGARIIAVDSDEWEHIYSLVLSGGHWTPMDTAAPEYRHVARPGWQYPNPRATIEFEFRA